MSYLFYTFIGAVITIVIGTIVSLIFDGRQDLEPLLFSPVIRKYISVQRLSPVKRHNDMEQDCIVHTFERQDNQI